MKFNAPVVELTQHHIDAALYHGMVRAVAGDLFLYNGPQSRGRQLRVRDAHGVGVLRTMEIDHRIAALSIGARIDCLR
jgi:hypothetical protein